MPFRNVLLYNDIKIGKLKRRTFLSGIWLYLGLNFRCNIHVTYWIKNDYHGDSIADSLPEPIDKENQYQIFPSSPSMNLSMGRCVIEMRGL